MAAIAPEELKALLTLLDDQDTEVYQHVQERLRSYGIPVISPLMEAWETTSNGILQDRIEQVIRLIHLTTSIADFKQWLHTPELDLLSGALIIARHRYPDFNEHLIWNRIDQLKRDIWVEMRGFTSPIEKINLFNHVYYRHWGFSVKPMEEDTNGQYFFLNRVIESRKGNNFTIALLYLALARQLGLPVHGILLPDNFCLAYCKKPLQAEAFITDTASLQRGIQFFINPANKGLIFTRHELREHLQKIGQADAYEDVVPVSSMQIIAQLLRALQTSYREQNQDGLAADINGYLKLLY